MCAAAWVLCLALRGHGRPSLRLVHLCLRPLPCRAAAYKSCTGQCTSLRRPYWLVTLCQVPVLRVSYFRRRSAYRFIATTICMWLRSYRRTCCTGNGSDLPTCTASR